MPRIEQGPGVKGSKKWIQKLVNEKPDLLNSLIRTKLDFPDTDSIRDKGGRRFQNNLRMGDILDPG